MASRIPGILRAVCATPWAIQPDKLNAIMELLELRAAGGVVPPDDVARIRAERRESTAPRSAGAIAVLPLYGVIAQKMNVMTDISGGTSCEMFGAAFDEAVQRSDVAAIVLDCDSPGGAVEGIPELAAKIFAARGEKPIIAIANSLMASAAYWIASAADEVLLTQTAQVGSIGVFCVQTDESEAYAKEGIKHNIISAGKFKTEGNSYEPLTPEAKAAMQAAIDDVYALFVADVAKHRGTSQKAVREGYGEGRVLRGKAALRAGLADRIGTLDSLVQELGAKSGSRRTTRMAAAATGIAVAAGPLHAVSIGPRDGIVARLLAAVPGELLAKKGAKADDFESDDMCQTCGAALDDDGECPNGHAQPDDIADPAPDNQAQSQLAADGAAARATPTPTEQAPAPGKEQTVDTPAAPANGAKPTDNMRALVQVAKAHGGTLDDAEAWAEAGLTTEQAKDTLLARMPKPMPVGVAGVRATGVHEKNDDRPRFPTWGAAVAAIIQVGKPDISADRKRELTGMLTARRAGDVGFQAGLASGMDETVGAEGGFFIQPELTSQVIDPIYKDDPILSRVTRVAIGSNTNGIKYNVVDETSRVIGNQWGGVNAFWGSEAGALSATKPKLRLFELSLKKLTGLAYLTEELTQDAPAAESLLTRAFQSVFQFNIANAIFNGTGAGEPQGFLNSGALVTVAKETSQTIANSSTYLGLNIPKMLMAVPSSLWGDVIWLYQQELLPYLMNASIAGSTAGAAVPIFVPMGGFTQRPFDMIMGRPAFPSELCAAVGTPGDILALVPSQYHLGEKGGINTAQSMHVRFLNDELVLRWIYRVDGASVWRTSVTPANGAVKRSPWVALATRT